MTAKEYLNKFGLDANPALFTNVTNGKHMKPKYNSYCFYDGVSQLDRRSPIIAVMSNCQYNPEDYNIKTGDMLQTYIIMRNVHPQHAIDFMLDDCICGKCVHKRDGRYTLSMASASQYVLAMSISARVLLQYGNHSRRARYQLYLALLLLLYKLLLASQHAWVHTVTLQLCRSLYGVTYYVIALAIVVTHQWRSKIAAPFKGILQASCDNYTDQYDAEQAGWGTFTVLPEHDYVNRRHVAYSKGMKQCPSDPFINEMRAYRNMLPMHTTCVGCPASLQCDGDSHVVIRAHGPAAKWV